MTHIWNVSEELRNDPDIVLAFAKKTGDAMLIEYAGENLKNNKDFLMQVASCDKNGYDSGLAMVLEHAGDTVRNDKQFFIKALQKDGHLYRYVGKALKDDTDLKMISAINILEERFSNANTFEEKVNMFLSRVKNGVSMREEDKPRPYSFSAELRNYELRNNFRPGIDDKIQEESVFVQESPEEIRRQIELLTHIKDVALSKEKAIQSVSPLQQREDELSSLEEEEKAITETEALIEKQTSKEGQDIGEN